MAASRRKTKELDSSAAQGKLSRLLDTETELDSMLRETRRAAKALIQSARAEAEERIRSFEMELNAADLALRDQIALERDERISAVRAEAKSTVDELEQLDDQRIEELARHVVERMTGFKPEGRS